MKDSYRKADGLLDIAAVERETGIAKGTLRIWERRYGFPCPQRDALGERAYPAEQVEKLRLIGRALATGARPAGVVGRGLGELRDLVEQSSPAIALAASSDSVAALVADLASRDNARLRRRLEELLQELGLRRFVVDVVAELNGAVGLAWASGALTVADEHRYSEQLAAVLRGGIDAARDVDRGADRTAGPRVLLTTLPDELHSLGLLMLEAVLTTTAAVPIPLGVQTPLREIAAVAAAGECDVVALSFSAAFPLRFAKRRLAELRDMLPPAVMLWAGGEGVRALRDPFRGLEVFRDLPSLLDNPCLQVR